MRQLVILVGIFLLLAFSVENAVNDKNEMRQHREFFEKMTNFANKGGRFTAEDGLKLCDEINKIKFHYNDLELIDCDRFDK